MIRRNFNSNLKGNIMLKNLAIATKATKASPFGVIDGLVLKEIV